MDGEFSALKILNEFRHSPPTVSGYSVRAYPTSLQELAVISTSRPREISPTRKEKMGEFNPGYLKDDNSIGAVLCAHVDKETTEVTHDILRQAFAKYGRIVCLVSFRHKGILHCLVEYPDCVKAGDVVKKLHGTPIYDDCCILRVFYSNLAKLEFRDDGKGLRKLLHTSSQFELSARTVSKLQVWSPRQDAAIAAKDMSRAVRNTAAAKNVTMGMIPRIPKLKAITNKGISSRPVRPIEKHKESEKQLQSVPTKPPNKDTHTSTSNGLTVPKVFPHNCPSKSPPPLINMSDKKTNSIDDNNVLNKQVTSPIKTNHKLPLSGDKDTHIDSIALPSPVPISGTEELTVEPDTGVDQSSDSVRDSTPFTLILDPSDCSDIETDASTSSVYCQKRFSDNGCQASPSCASVATEAGCQYITLSSVGLQCDVVDEEMRKMASACQEKLKLLQSQCAEIAELNERNKTLLEENAELKRLLSEVHGEMTKLQEAVNSTPPRPDSSTDSGTNVKVENEVEVTRNHEVAPSHGSQQPKRKVSLADIPMFETSSTVTNQPGRPRKRALSCDGSSPGPSNHKKNHSFKGHESVKKKSHKLDKEKKKSYLSSLTKGVHNGNKSTNGYAKKIRNKFLFSLINTFLKAQKFISVKVELMKEAMKGLTDGDLLQLMGKIVPQLDSISDATIDLKRLSNLDMVGYEDALFSLISKLPNLFPDIIKQLNGTNLSIPGTSQTLLGVLRKMESLATDMCKYIPQTLAFGNAGTGETTSVEDSSDAKPPELLPPMSVDELLDKKPVSEEKPTSLIVSISTKHLKPFGSKQLPDSSEENVPSPPLNVGGKRVCATTTPAESDHSTPSPPEAQEDKMDTIVEMSTPDGDIATQDSVTEVFSTSSTSSLQAADTMETTAECASDDAKNEVVITKLTNPHASSISVTVAGSLAGTPPTDAVSKTSVTPPPHSTNHTIAATSVEQASSEATPVLSAFPADQNVVTTVVAPVTQAPPPYNAALPAWSRVTPVSSCAAPDLRASCPAINNLGPFVPLPAAPIPPTPVVKINMSAEGLVIKWTLQQIDIHLASQVESYCLSAFEGASPPSPEQWETVGKMRALQLPMACTLTHFVQGTTYHFAVRAISKGGVRGQFSRARSIDL
ncbi:uncharacterized protein [Dysidea avara]